MVLELYPDGSYGPHEYSTEPQVWDPSRPHLPWIPRSPQAFERAEGLQVLWRPLHRDDYAPANPDRPDGVFFRITDRLAVQLQQALVPVHELAESISRDHNPDKDIIRNACDLARHSLIHIRYSDAHRLPALVDLVRGAKRNILECLGYLLYREFNRTAPVLDPVHEDIVRPPRDVVGLFTYDIEIARRHVRLRVPVWRITEVDSLSANMKIAARVQVAPTFYAAGQKKLIAHVYDGEPYIAKLMVANPSQGLYRLIPEQGTYRFVGSVNTAGDIITRADDDHDEVQSSQAARVGPASTSGGPTRTYPGT